MEKYEHDYITSLKTWILEKYKSLFSASSSTCGTNVVNTSMQQDRKCLQPQDSRTLCPLSWVWKQSCSICTLSDGASGGCGGVTGMLDHPDQRLVTVRKCTTKQWTEGWKPCATGMGMSKTIIHNQDEYLSHTKRQLRFSTLCLCATTFRSLREGILLSSNLQPSFLKGFSLFCDLPQMFMIYKTVCCLINALLLLNTKLPPQ